MNFGIVRLYCGASGKKGFYNSQEIGLAKAMKKLGYVCFIFLPNLNEDNCIEEQVEENITIVKCPAKAIGIHSKFAWSVLKKYRVQVVQVGADNQLFAAELISYCDAHNIRVYSFIGTVRSNSNKNLLKKIVMRFFLERNLRKYRTHKNFAKTEYVKKELEVLGIKDIDIAPVGLDISIIPEIKGTRDEIRRDCGLPCEKKLILYVGRIDFYKHPEDMLAVLSKLPNEYYGVMIGDGKLRYQIDLKIKELGLENRLKWIRCLSNEEVQKYYFAADFFINFNSQEIFGMSILEAMYQGCTVIARHAPGPDMIIENGMTGYLVDDLENIVNKICLPDVQLNREVIRERIKERFTWDNTATIIDEWINRINVLIG